MNNQARIERMRERLTATLSPTTLEIQDDSRLHAGHEGAKSGKGHFTLRITAASFQGKSLVEQHRMVYQALGEMMETDIHALSIQARTPPE